LIEVRSRLCLSKSTASFSATKLHADDSPVPVLAPGTGRTKTGRLWTYVRDYRPANDPMPPAEWFAYRPDRKGEHPRRHLNQFSDTLQADGYAGFHHLYDTGRIQEAACWAHVRRKFFDIQTAHHSSIRSRGDRTHRCTLRYRERSPRQASGAASRASSVAGAVTAVAIRYALSRWTALCRYVDDGHIEVDNNAAERALRAVCLGRKKLPLRRLR
jgi:transposase